MAAALGFEEESSENKFYSLTPSFGNNKPYNNSKKASQKEREGILLVIKNKKYPSPGTDAIRINEKNNIYLIDHSSDSELYDNLKDGGDGFGIRSVFDVDKLTEDDCRTILRNIAGDYGYSETRVRKVLQDIGIGPGLMFRIDFAAELEVAARNDADMDASGRGQRKETGYNRSGVDGGENQNSGGSQGEALGQFSLVRLDSNGNPVKESHPVTRAGGGARKIRVPL